jgi:hypothetical protein
MKKPMWILELKIVRMGDKEEDDYERIRCANLRCRIEEGR